jgi:hypothetical protein
MERTIMTTPPKPERTAEGRMRLEEETTPSEAIRVLDEWWARRSRQAFLPPLDADTATLANTLRYILCRLERLEGEAK